MKRKQRLMILGWSWYWYIIVPLEVFIVMSAYYVGKFVGTGEGCF